MSRVSRSPRLHLLLALILPCYGCSSSESPLVPSPAPEPRAQLPSTSLTINVRRLVGGSTEPLAGAQVYVVDPEYGPYDAFVPKGGLTDAAGKTTVNGLEATRTVDVVAFFSGLTQPCAVQPAMRSDTVVDIVLVPPGELPPSAGSPVVSGTIFYLDMLGQRQNAAGAYVSYAAGRSETTAYAFADSQGRYRLCSLPNRGVISASCRAPSANSTIVPIEVTGDPVRDIDVTSNRSQC